MKAAEPDEAVPQPFAQFTARTSPKCPQLPKRMTRQPVRNDQASPRQQPQCRCDALAMVSEDTSTHESGPAAAP